MTGTIGRIAVAVFLLGASLGCEGRILGPAAVAPPETTESLPGPESDPAPAENKPPVIDAFIGSPNATPVPVPISFTWSVSDPDGDALSCALDFDGDGVDDEAIPDCTSLKSTQTTYLTPGTWTPRLTVQDARGGSAVETFQLETLPTPTVDVSIARIEWGQSVIGRELRLVAGKPALLRVHVLSNEPGTPAVVVRVTGTLDGMSLGQLELEGPSLLPTAVDAGRLERSFRAHIPEAWVTPGVELRVQVDPDQAQFELDESNNEATLEPDVGAGTVLQLIAVPVVHQGRTAQIPAAHVNALWKLWPLKEIQSKTRAPYTSSQTLTGSGSRAWSNLLGELASVRRADGSAAYYYGFVDVSYGSGIAGIGYVGNPVATGRDDSLETLVHELGHNFGREHAPCGTNGDPGYPYPNGRLGSWGYDLEKRTLISPTQTYDLMSYCNPTWVSDHNYAQVQKFLESKKSAARSALADAPLLLISGSIDQDGTVRVRPLHRLTGAEEHRREGPWRLRLHTREGPLDLDFGTERVAEIDEEHFTLLVRDPGPLAGFEILRDEEVLLRQDAKPVEHTLIPPQLEERDGMLELHWDATTQPTARVTHVGTSRTTLGLWLTDGHAVLPTSSLEDGGTFELGLSDGVNSERWTFER